MIKNLTSPMGREGHVCVCLLFLKAGKANIVLFLVIFTYKIFNNIIYFKFFLSQIVILNNIVIINQLVKLK